MKRVVLTLCLLALLGGGSVSAASWFSKKASDETKAKKEERKHRDMLKKEEKKQAREQRVTDLGSKKTHKKDVRRNKKESRAEAERQLALNEDKLLKDQIERLRFARQNRAEKMNRWNELHALETSRDIDAGCYADLYKAPAWPVACGFFEKKDLLNVGMSYKYATDAYASDRSRTDITGIEFGYNPITLQDISLASKLVNAGKLTYAGNTALQAAIVAASSALTLAVADAAAGEVAFRAAVASMAGSGDLAANQAAVAAAIGGFSSSTKTIVAAKAAANKYFKSLATTPIHFNGKSEEYGTSLDFARYVMGKNVQLGVQIPVLYRHNKLECDFAYINDFLSAKGINELGGSATGLGDIVLFANVQTGARTFEKVLGGLKVTLPSGKQASTAKLWAPELGTGHAQFSAYAGVLMDHSRLLNPHVYLEGIYSMASHENKRVPVKVTGTKSGANLVITEQDNTKTVGADAALTTDLMAMGDRLKTLAAPGAFTEYDTTVKGFGDKVSTIRMLHGLAFKARVGNIIEKFIARRGFLDVYYDLYVKFHDGARGLNTQDYNLPIFSQRTNVLAHKIGSEFTYQFDADTRLRAGMTYVFAGSNAPKAFEISSALGYSF